MDIEDQQDGSYPDPAQLRAFAREPMPFHTVKPSDPDLIEHDILRYSVENVEYQWFPEYIHVETSADKWETIERTQYNITHENAWEKAEHATIEEDYITAQFVPQTVDLWQAKAVWILDTITIQTGE